VKSSISSKMRLKLEEAACDLPLDLDLLGPIAILGRAQLVAQLRELGDVGGGVVGLAGARRPKRTCET
jgi:hypothetical protein